MPKKKEDPSTFTSFISLIIAVILIGTVVKCSSSSNKTKTTSSSDFSQIYMAKQSLEKRLKDPDSVKYGDVYVHKPSSAVCGTYNAKNGFGAYAGKKLFFSAGGVLVAQGDIEDKKFAEMMQKMCVDE